MEVLLQLLHKFRPPNDEPNVETFAPEFAVA
jgi:hypothetical protein